MKAAEQRVSEAEKRIRYAQARHLKVRQQDECEVERTASPDISAFIFKMYEERKYSYLMLNQHAEISHDPLFDKRYAQVSTNVESVNARVKAIDAAIVAQKHSAMSRMLM